MIIINGIFIIYGLRVVLNFIHIVLQHTVFVITDGTGLMMADRHPTGCRSPSLLCNGKMPIGEYWTISLYADWGKLMAAIGINSPPIEWTIGINF